MCKKKKPRVSTKKETVMYRINHADIKKWAAEYKGELFDAVLCDPPYEISFMQKSWDGSGIAHDTEMWADILKLLKPGAHLLAFSGSRTYHRMAVAIEDAGFEIRDMIEWVYGSGFPKSHNVANAVDKLGGASNRGHAISSGSQIHPTTGKKRANGELLPAYKARTEAGQVWEGYGTALKPAHEPCVLARKPISEKNIALNVLKHGTGGLAIDATRIPTTETWKNAAQDIRGGNLMGKAGRHPNLIKESNSLGRFPSNLILDGSDEVEAVFPQTGKSRPDHRNEPSSTGDSGIYGKGYKRQPNMLNDSGSASRFFYTAKSSKSERNAGLEGFEDRRAGAMEFRNRESEKGQFEGEPQYAKNYHPTVKPLSLTKYLATLIKPPTGGRLLVPFSGSGSEMIGALQAGWEYVEGVELTEEYIPIAEARIKYWLEQAGKEQISLL